MKITYYGTSASEAWPALFCSCEACRLARQEGGKNVRSRSQALVDSSLLIDFPPDTGYHVQVMHLDLQAVRTLLVTHSHHDHFFPHDIFMKISDFTGGMEQDKLFVYGNEQVRKLFSQAANEHERWEQFVEFRPIRPFESVLTEDGYEVTALLADHNYPEQSLLYQIRRDGKQLLYAHDTGIFPEVTWQFLAGEHFDLVSFDCTALSREWRNGHMGFEAVDAVRSRMEKMGCIGPSTVLVLSHFAHHGNFTHDKICAMENPKGYQVAYDGCCFAL